MRRPFRKNQEVPEILPAFPLRVLDHALHESNHGKWSPLRVVDGCERNGKVYLLWRQMQSWVRRPDRKGHSTIKVTKDSPSGRFLLKSLNLVVGAWELIAAETILKSHCKTDTHLRPLTYVRGARNRTMKKSVNAKTKRRADGATIRV